MAAAAGGKPVTPDTCCGQLMAAVEIRDVYDGALWLECVSCHMRLHRWPEGDWRRAKAEAIWRRHWQTPNEAMPRWEGL